MANPLLVTNFNGSLSGTDGDGVVTWTNANGTIGYTPDPVSATDRLDLNAGATVRTTSGSSHILTAAGMAVARVTITSAAQIGMIFNAGNYSSGKTWIDMRTENGGTFYCRFIDNGTLAEVNGGLASEPTQDVPTLVWVEWTATQFRGGVYGGVTLAWTNRGDTAQTIDDTWGMTAGGRGDGTTETLTDGLLGPLAIYDAGLTSDELDLLNAADLWDFETHIPSAANPTLRRIRSQFQLRPY